MAKTNVTWSVDLEVAKAVQQEAAKRSKASGTKVSASAAVNAVLREALLSSPQAMRPAQPKVLTRSAPKPGGEPRYVKDEENGQ